MTTPPSSLPSPAPSSGSSQQPNKPPPTFSSIAAQPPQTSSSTTASTSPSTTSHNMADHASSKDSSSDSYGDDVQQTPQPQPNSNYQSTSASFLPPVTASPPPHAPPYVPPAQHAMAPDPIHSLALPGQPGNVWGAGWRPGPPGGPPGAPGYAHPQGYGRGAPNGHLTHQLPPNPMEAYGPNSRQSMTSTPGPAPLTGINGSHIARSGSQPGEPRDRRRERHRDDEGRDREDEEVISTIFVVGFPDDMSEREFQNIFTFAPGFEAATLKFPSGSRREPAGAAALLAELQHIAAQQNMGPQMMNPDHPDQPLDESFAAMTFATQSSSASNTPSAAMSLTPSAPTGSTLGTTSMPQQVPPRRQTIGFARFKTRGDALAARDHLQGRRIDTLTGATLKAEMAKKNLHTKRGVAGDDLVGLLLRSGRLSQLVSQQAVQSQGGIPGATGTGLGQPNAGQLSGPGNMPMPSQNPGAAQSAKEAWDAWPAPGQASTETKSDKLTTHQGGGSAQSNTSGSPPLSGKSPNSRPTDSKALLALAEEADELEGWSVGSVGMGGMALEPYPSAGSGGPGSRSGPHPGSGPMPGSQQGIGSGGYGYGGQHGSYSSALGFGGGPEGAIDPRSLGITANMNPADQNPPINTLYIGNLPAISPPTHPPNFLEESLRALFQRRPGFKRMSFRQKINGPMCFVEFEDIPYATQAMRELYGNTLNGLVKGGIRLSYSKNSLGQRGNSHQQAMNSATFGGIAHTVALAGMSTAPSGMPIGPGGAPQGSYSMAASSQPVPIGTPSGNQGNNAERRGAGENSSSLSPNAQPFNAPLPTSPRSQRFYGPSSLDRQNSSGNASSSSATPSQATAIPGAGGQSEAAFNSFAPSSVGGGPQGGFSPVSSPIRTPASLGWVSSSSGPGSSNTFGAFDAFGAHHGLSSLNGAANAWGHANSTNTSG